QACINQQCTDPCQCGENAICRVVDHRAICQCLEGYQGNPDVRCIAIGCQSDNNCPSDQVCSNRQCINPCLINDPCAPNAECYAEDHSAKCRCRDGYEGSPDGYTNCVVVGCKSNSECPPLMACINRQCVDPCIYANPCGANANCVSQNHAATCICPPGFIGDPQVACVETEPIVTEPPCRLDSDCASGLACLNEVCANPCEVIGPCHSTATCRVLDTVPYRTMICTCPDGWAPLADGRCRPLETEVPPGCVTDDDCPDVQACINRQCRDPCACGANADCQVTGHRAVCVCRPGFYGNPRIGCSPIGCTSNEECPDPESCYQGNCVNPCLIYNPCLPNAECYGQNHIGQCRCLPGYEGDGLYSCKPIGCRVDSECPDDQACYNGVCRNPCQVDNPCAANADCRASEHRAMCYCRPGMVGNPYSFCQEEVTAECQVDADCREGLACIMQVCQDPCLKSEPCHPSATCRVLSTVPVRTMVCVCPDGHVTAPGGSCQPIPILTGICTTDEDCSDTEACINNKCGSPCNCGPNADCRVLDHKPICVCKDGFAGRPELGCHEIDCESNDECPASHSCINKLCVPVCGVGNPCAPSADCIPTDHQPVCQCPTGTTGNPIQGCVPIGCQSNSECPPDRACQNGQCVDLCQFADPCNPPAECSVQNHDISCRCPDGYEGNPQTGCTPVVVGCRSDSECPPSLACINGQCQNPCEVLHPCAPNAICKVIDTLPVRTITCECPEGYFGNAVVECRQTPPCETERGFELINNVCVCPEEKGKALDRNGDCIVCPISQGFTIIDGRCVCDSSRGFQNCAPNAFCQAERHRATCICVAGYVGDGDVACIFVTPTPPSTRPPVARTDAPIPEMTVNCLSDRIQVDIAAADATSAGSTALDGVLYVKGYSDRSECRAVINGIPPGGVLDFKVRFNTCGLIHVNGEAAFILVFQKHPKLVTHKAQAFHVKCIYKTGPATVTLGFNVSMFTTSGTIANTGPPPVCIMRIVADVEDDDDSNSPSDISSVQIGDRLKLIVSVTPTLIYGGFVRNCVAKTMDDENENTYLVTDENGCATDPSVFGEFFYDPTLNATVARFDAFKFPSSNSIRFQCNVRVCFGQCQPVNCGGIDVHGKKRKKRQADTFFVDVEDEDPHVVQTYNTGAFAEEIVVESNAILTFEKSERRVAVQPLEPEEVCISMVWFILALIITALLSLVAVAVAVSCWLLSYRRHERGVGPLPHPIDFPNPLFTTPEPLAEPSPDYITDDNDR
ncbi:unnamed protein product, partial [Cyprideis torosa]